MFAGLSERLAGVFEKLTKRGILTEEAVDDALREIKVALLEADVALPVVKSFVSSVREKAVGEKIIKSVAPAQMVVKIVHDALMELLGETRQLNLAQRRPAVVLMMGLQGSGKTTQTAKLAWRLQKERKKVLCASADTYRPAAREQLAELGVKNGLDVLPMAPQEKPLAIVRRALAEAQKGLYDVLLLDTAGRLHIDAELMAELKQIKELAAPAESLLVADALMGQDAVRVAGAFQEQVGVSGTLLTRIDGDARGGAALSLCATTGVPILFLGVGEKIEDLEAFDAKRVADRILGMGDVVGLVETALTKINQEEAQKTAARMMSGQFNLEDLLAQLRQIGRMGDIKGVMKMIPGMAALQKQMASSAMDDKMIKRQEAVILSMTPRERRHPDLLKASRKQRIAAGAGVCVNDVNRLLKQYEQMADVMKKIKKMGPLGLMSLMKKMGADSGGANPFANTGGFPPLH